ncbi:hypothetical protein FW774_18650 [Pedobacter sp. BS3]|uniref:hypothetical protein n=1 Tax=Pedobacter sp. BS3 TaxID=2567937 RepID=UPI0011EE7844|nr:hypothetical protein [Pedobacter sp. BS3]TZF81294.1 hypothetical protein FW774_18650 [Pedobacter sp. BS3]
MPTIQDKEFDTFFRQKFEGFEVEPAVNLWAKIADELDGRPVRKKRYSFLWMAASIIVVISVAWFWFRPQSQVIIQARKVKKPEATVSPVKQEEKIPVYTAVKPDISTSHEKKVVKIPGRINNVDSNTSGNKGIVLNGADSAATVQPSEKLAEIKETIPAVNVEQVTVPVAALRQKQALAAVNLEQGLSTDSVSQTRPRIKSVGDIINFVVSKVDKRPEKLLQFQDSDEGAEVTGINLGLVKYRSRNK